MMMMRAEARPPILLFASGWSHSIFAYLSGQSLYGIKQGSRLQIKAGFDRLCRYVQVSNVALETGISASTTHLDAHHGFLA